MAFYSQTQEELLFRLEALEIFWNSEQAETVASPLGINLSSFRHSTWKLSILEQYNPITTVFAPNASDLAEACGATDEVVKKLHQVKDFLFSKIPMADRIDFVGGKYFSVVNGSTSLFPVIGSTNLLTNSEFSKVNLRPVSLLMVKRDSLWSVFEKEEMPEKFYKVYRSALLLFSGAEISYVEFCKKVIDLYCEGTSISCRDTLFQKKRFLKETISDYEQLARFCGVDCFSYYEKMGNGYGALKHAEAELFSSFLSNNNYTIVLPKKIIYLLVAIGVGKIIAIDDGDLISEFEELYPKVLSLTGVEPPFMSYR